MAEVSAGAGGRARDVAWPGAECHLQQHTLPLLFFQFQLSWKNITSEDIIHI